MAGGSGLHGSVNTVHPHHRSLAAGTLRVQQARSLEASRGRVLLGDQCVSLEGNHVGGEFMIDQGFCSLIYMLNHMAGVQSSNLAGNSSSLITTSISDRVGSKDSFLHSPIPAMRMKRFHYNLYYP